MFVIKPEYKGNNVYLRKLGMKVEAVDANAEMLYCNGCEHMVNVFKPLVFEEPKKETTKRKKKRTDDN